MELSESQIVQPWSWSSTPTTFPIIADLAIRAGYLQEASSRARKRTSSLASKSGVPGDAEWSPFSSLDCAFECFFAFTNFEIAKTQSQT